MKHKHHIIPKHMGGTDDTENLIEVTVDEHANLHKQLWEDLGYWQDEIAWKGLSGQISSFEASQEARRRSMTGRIVSEETRRKIGKSNANRIVSEETRSKLREKGLGRTFSDETRMKISNALSNNKNRSGVKNSMEHNLAIGLSNKGHKKGMTGKKHSPETIEKMRLSHSKRRNEAIQC